MKKYILNIADIYYSVETDDNHISFQPGIGFADFLADEIPENIQPIIVRVTSGTPELNDYTTIFDTPLSPDGKKLWSILGNGENYCLHAFYQNMSHDEVFAFFHPDDLNWQIFLNTKDRYNIMTDPFEYPLGPIMMLYSTIMNNGIMVHASGVRMNAHGYIFCGFSGTGKSTIAGILEDSGADMINDDRLIIRKRENQYVIHNTPMYYPDKRKETPLHFCLFLKQSLQNYFTPMTGVHAISRLSSFCMQHNFSKQLIKYQLETISDICNHVSCGILGFYPDINVRTLLDNIYKNKTK